MLSKTAHVGVLCFHSGVTNLATPASHRHATYRSRIAPSVVQQALCAEATARGKGHKGQTYHCSVLASTAPTLLDGSETPKIPSSIQCHNIAAFLDAGLCCRILAWMGSHTSEHQASARICALADPFVIRPPNISNMVRCTARKESHASAVTMPGPLRLSHLLKHLRTWA